jgi:hypothetical protein
MAIDEQSRHHLHQVLEQRLGPDAAVTLMEHLPPVGWADVATKRDLDQQTSALRTEISHRFEAVDHRFGAVDHRFEAVDHRFDVIDQRFDAVDQRFDAVDQRFDAVDRRFETMDRRFDLLDERFDRLEQRFDTFGAQIDGRVDQRTSKLVWGLYGIQAAMLAALLAAVVALAT